MDENLIKLIGCFDYDRMKKQCQKYDLTKVTEIDNKSEEQLETYEMTTEEEITKGDILNITGSMFDIMLDYVDNSNNELEQLQQENKKYKEVIDKIQKHCEIEINASNHYLENHSSQQELCHKVAHQRILDILKEVK